MKKLTVEELIAKERQLWRRACLFDGIDPKEKFISDFSVGNPYKAEHEKTVEKLLFVKACLAGKVNPILV